MGILQVEFYFASLVFLYFNALLSLFSLFFSAFGCDRSKSNNKEFGSICKETQKTNYPHYNFWLNYYQHIFNYRICIFFTRISDWQLRRLIIVLNLREISLIESLIVLGHFFLLSVQQGIQAGGGIGEILGNVGTKVCLFSFLDHLIIYLMIFYDI